MKFLKLLAILSVFWSFYSLYGVPGNNPNDSYGDLYSCYVTAVINESVTLKTGIEANAYCRSVYNIYSVDSGCFVRGLATGEFESNFSQKMIFSGWDSLEKYKQWASDHVHKGYFIKHTVYYSGKCFNQFPNQDIDF